MDILRAIGNTSMVRLRKVVPPDCAEILVKLEWENPSGSLKDRMAEAVISRAEEDGRLKPGDTVVTPAAARGLRWRWSAPRRDIGSTSSARTRSVRTSWIT